MARYELSLATNYVPSWTVVDAVRELFQNALDQQNTVEGNDMFFDYIEEEEKLIIGNKLSVLEPKTLLLGSTTKAGDPNTIGKFGEGYKIASLVLVRSGKQVVFYNYGAREVWKPRFSNSRKYGTQILVFDVTKNFIWQSVPDNNLTIEVGGITKEEWEDIIESNLNLQEGYEYIDTEYGNILLDKDLAGRVYVNGLLVCLYEPYVYGYDFKPAHLNLDRDRKMANPFDLEWLASKMWSSVKDEESREKAAELVIREAADVAHIKTVSAFFPSSDRIADIALDKLGVREGKTAILLPSENIARYVKAGYTPIVVSNTVAGMLSMSSSYSSYRPSLEDEEDDGLSVKEALEKWFDDYSLYLPDKEAEERFKKILERIED